MEHTAYLINPAGRRVSVAAHRVEMLLEQGFRLADPVANEAQAPATPSAVTPNPPAAAGATAPAAPAPVAAPKDMMSMTKVQLIERAAQAGIQADMSWSKPRLVDAIREAAKG